MALLIYAARPSCVFLLPRIGDGGVAGMSAIIYYATGFKI